MTTHYALFYIHNNPDIDYGTSGGVDVDLIGLFDTKEKAYQWIVDEYNKPHDNDNPYFPYKHNPNKIPTLAEFCDPHIETVGYFKPDDYDGVDHFRLVELKDNQSVNITLGFWSYRE